MKFAKYIFLCFFLSAATLSFGQLYQNYPKGYFMFPIKPGQRNYLSANMGELRPNHFHSGIDIKTDGQIGLPVYCAADGYVSRIKVSTYGYGNTLYITHPNGLVSVYAHLDKFNKIIQQYTLTQLYTLEETDIDIVVEPGTLVFKKGNIIASSGNTGSSGGPHLHFEIRDQYERVLNPVLFGFTELIDNIAPTFDKIAIRTMDMNARVNDEFGKAEFKAVYKSAGKYYIPEKITGKGMLGLELKAFDKMNETHNTYGINCIEVKMDGKEIFYHNLETFAFNESRYINVHIDYESFILKRQRFEKCYVADGNNLTFYLMNQQKGKLMINDTTTHQVEIRIYDSNGNHSSLTFAIKGKQETKSVVTKSTTPVPDYRIFENTLKLIGPANYKENASVYLKNKTIQSLAPSYYMNQSPVYLYDLRKSLPDSIVAGYYKPSFDFIEMIPPGEKTVNIDNLTLRFSDSTLFDTLFLRVKNHIMEGGRETFEINNTTEPIYGPVGVIFCPKNVDNKHEKCYFHSINNSSSTKYEGGEWEEDSLSHNLKYLGKYMLVKDTVPPTVTYKSHSLNRIYFNIFDRGSGIKTIRATLNGQWVMMYYEHKSGLIWSELKDATQTLKGEFILEITDKSGNLTSVKKQL